MTTSTIRLVNEWAVILVLANSACASPPDTPHRESSKGAADVVECRVSINFGTVVDVRITDSKVINKVVVEPLMKARVDPAPVKYVLIGSISLKRKDGSEDRFAMFSPWGHCKKGDKHIIADLSGLQKVCKDALAKAAEYLVTGEPRPKPPPD